MVYEFSDATFQSDVLDNNGVTVVDLWAEWCGPCKVMLPIIDELANEYKGKAVIGKLNVDDNPEVPTNYSVGGIPTILIFKGGELKQRVVGPQSKHFLKDHIDAVIG